MNMRLRFFLTLLIGCILSGIAGVTPLHAATTEIQAMKDWGFARHSIFVDFRASNYYVLGLYTTANAKGAFSCIMCRLQMQPFLPLLVVPPLPGRPQWCHGQVPLLHRRPSTHRRQRLRQLQHPSPDPWQHKHNYVKQWIPLLVKQNSNLLPYHRWEYLDD
jgi:hypothetical protein